MSKRDGLERFKPTDFRSARDRFKSSHPFGNMVVTPNTVMMDALGYDPSQDGLILCPKCGVTWDYECAYGGWHDERHYVQVTVPWMEDDDWGRHL